MHILQKWLRTYGPETEAGAGDEGKTTPPMNERPVDGPGSGRSDIRRSLEKGFEEDRKTREADEGDDTKTRDTKSGKFVRGKSRPAAGVGGREEEEAEQRTEGEEGTGGEQKTEGEEGAVEEAAEGTEAAATAAPASWPKDKAEVWSKLDPAAREVFTKRETEMAAGVDQIKKRYEDIDKALAPRMEVLRAHGHSPAAGINQLFSWMEALTSHPEIAFPALAKSYNFDLAKLFTPAGGDGKEAAAAAAAAGTGTEEIDLSKLPVEVATYIKKVQDDNAGLRTYVENEIGGLKTTFQEQQLAKSTEIMNRWAQGKTHFEDVRVHMAKLLSNGMVESLPDGSADLDRAYDMAINAYPEIRAKVRAEERAKEDADRKAKADKEKKLQQEQADKSRRASGSLRGSAPGDEAKPGNKKPQKTSVGDSIKQAIQEVRERDERV